MKLPLSLRKLAGIIARYLSPGFGYCFRCKRPWNICNGHYTRYTQHHGCFPLCEDCWSELTIEGRLPYYHQLWLEWKVFSETDISNVSWNVTWERMERAVREGR